MVAILAQLPISGSSASQHAASGTATDFGAMLSHTMSSVVDQSASTEVAAQQTLAGAGDMTQVVTSVTQAQLALQTTVAIRDRLVQAYQSIMNMPI